LEHVEHELDLQRLRRPRGELQRRRIALAVLVHLPRHLLVDRELLGVEADLDLARGVRALAGLEHGLGQRARITGIERRFGFQRHYSPLRNLATSWRRQISSQISRAMSASSSSSPSAPPPPGAWDRLLGRAAGLVPSPASAARRVVAEVAAAPISVSSG